MKLWQAAQSLTIKKTPCHFRQKETSPVPSYSPESMCPRGDLNCLFMIFKKGTQSGDHSPDNTFDCTVQTNPQNKENYRCTQWCQWASKPLRSIKGTRTGRANSKQTEISGVCAVWFVCLKQLFWFKKKWTVRGQMLRGWNGKEAQCMLWVKTYQLYHSKTCRLVCGPYPFQCTFSKKSQRGGIQRLKFHISKREERQTYRRFN